MVHSAIAGLLNQILSSPLALFFVRVAALVVPSIAVIFVSDWYSRRKLLRQATRIQSLEALYALEDPRTPGGSAQRAWRA